MCFLLVVGRFSAKLGISQKKSLASQLEMTPANRNSPKSMDDLGAPNLEY